MDSTPNYDGLYDIIKEIRSNKFCDFYIGFGKLYKLVVEYLVFIKFCLCDKYCLDPHVRVAGRLDDVKQAREKIMQLLDTRVSYLELREVK